MLNAIPIIGWLLSFLLSMSIAIPFWVLWSAVGIGETYFYWLPQVYQSLPFWDCVWLAMVFGILKAVLFFRVNNPVNIDKWTKK